MDQRRSLRPHHRSGRRTLPLMAGVVAVVLSSCAGGGSSAADGAEPVRVTIVPGILDPMVPQIGAHFGIFAKHDVELSFVEVNNGPAMVSAIASGAADVGEAGPIVSFPAYERGAKLTWLMNNYDIDYSLIARKDVALPHGTDAYPAGVVDLKGKRIGVAARGGQTERFVSRALKAAGLTDADVTYVAVGAGVSAVGAFQNDQVDAMVSFPPAQFLLDPSSYTTVVDLKTTQSKVFGDGYVFTAQAANSTFVDERPEAAKAYCAGFRDTLSFAKDPQNLDAVAEFLADKLNIPAAQAREMWQTYGVNFSADLTRERWDGLAKFELGSPVPAWDKAVFAPCASGS